MTYKDKNIKKFRVKQRQLAIREYINSVKSQGCKLCGYNKCITAIEFHHIGDDKVFEMSDCSNRSLDMIKKEISKCIIVCANCHRELHEHSVGSAIKGESNKQDQLELW